MYLLQTSSRHSQQGVLYRQEDLRHNAVVVFDQQIVIVAHRSRGGILNGQYPVVRPSILHGPHGLLPGAHMEGVRVLAEVGHGRLMAVGPFHALVHHSGSLHGNPVNLLKAGVKGLSVLRQQAVLQPSADGHQLGKQLRRSLAVLLARHLPDRLQLLLLPLPVVHRLSHGNLVLRHVAAQFHPFFIQIHDLSVDHIQFFPDLL